VIQLLLRQPRGGQHCSTAIQHSDNKKKLARFEAQEKRNEIVDAAAYRVVVASFSNTRRVFELKKIK
jgi:hypothetical protein